MAIAVGNVHLHTHSHMAGKISLEIEFDCCRVWWKRKKGPPDWAAGIPRTQLELHWLSGLEVTLCLPLTKTNGLHNIFYCQLQLVALSIWGGPLLLPASLHLLVYK